QKTIRVEGERYSLDRQYVPPPPIADHTRRILTAMLDESARIRANNQLYFESSIGMDPMFAGAWTEAANNPVGVREAAYAGATAPLRSRPMPAAQAAGPRAPNSYDIAAGMGLNIHPSLLQNSRNERSFLTAVGDVARHERALAASEMQFQRDLAAIEANN